MKSINIKLDKKYSGFFLSRNLKSAKIIINSISKPQVDCFIYQSPKRVLFVLIGDHHLEPILVWFQDAHLLIKGSSIVMGLLDNTGV